MLRKERKITMEQILDKVSFIDEFTKIRNMPVKKAEEHTEGFRYIHEMTTKKLATGDDFKIGSLDFSKFTYNDLEEYMEYYNEILEPKVKTASELFRIIRNAGSVFSPEKKFF